MNQTTIGGFHEHDANQVIASWLNESRSDWQASGERTKTIKGSADRPDIVIQQGDRMPVIIECEYGRPAVGDAIKRLGKELVNETRPFTEIIAIGIDKKCDDDSPLEFRNRLAARELILEIQLVRGVDRANSTIWPSTPLPCRLEDLIAYCEYAQVPQTVIDDQSRQIAQKIEAAGSSLLTSIRRTGVLGERTLTKLREQTGCRHPHEKEPNAIPPEERPDFLTASCPNKCDHDAQAARTTCAIWLIAIDLQNDLAQYSEELQARNLKTTQAIKDSATVGILTASEILKEWTTISTVNYLPVIEIAIDTMKAGELGTSISDILELLHQLSEQLNGLHAKHIYNFAGELWQLIVTDREERAAHYTRPEIAELLAAISAARFKGMTHQQIGEINLMDAACGTGTLIGAGERAIRREYTAKGGRDAELHRKRMEQKIYAMDINGIAGTLTAKRLTDMNVEQDYAKSKIAVITDPAGSLILLNPTITGISQVLGYRSVTPTKGISGEEGYFHVMLESINWSLMNPPYSRPRRDRQQATKGLTRPRQEAKKRKYLMSNGQAGLATDFGNMTNIRLAPGGIYSTVLPLTAAHAPTWKAWRKELEKDFENITVVANTAPSQLQSMSADTGMGELLIIATKKARRPTTWQATRILAVNLATSPKTMAEGYAMAQEISNITREQEQGRIRHGSYSWVTQSEAGFPWGAVGISNNDTTLVNETLMEAKAYDPQTLEVHDLAIPMTTLSKLAGTGPTHDLIGHPPDGDGRGAFKWTPLKEMEVKPTQQSMWAAQSNEQKTIKTNATHGGAETDKALAKRMTKLRSKWFTSRNMRWTSQAVTVVNTPRLNHGGRAWNALQNVEDDIGKCLALYYNSILGAIVLNAYGQSTQAGRATIQVSATAGIPCPNFGEDSPAGATARRIAEANYDKLSKMKLEPFAFCFRDKNRYKIDNVVAEMMGLNPEEKTTREMLNEYRKLFCNEPSVNGRQQSIIKAVTEYYNEE